MPIYAYRCESCGHSKDLLQKISDPTLTDCPACGGATFKKQLTAAGFQLKGSGWYVTDFRGGDKGAADSASPTTSATATDKSESKPVEAASAKTETPAATTTGTAS